MEIQIGVENASPIRKKNELTLNPISRNPIQEPIYGNLNNKVHYDNLEMYLHNYINSQAMKDEFLVSPILCTIF